MKKRCSKHEEEVIQFFCKNHEVFICSECMKLNHTDGSCHVTYIPDTSGELFDGTEYTKTLTDLNALLDKCLTVKRETRIAVDQSISLMGTVFDEIRNFQNELETTVVDLEKQLGNKVKSLQQENSTKPEHAEKACSDVQTSQDTNDTNSNETTETDIIETESSQAKTTSMENVESERIEYDKTTSENMSNEEMISSNQVPHETHDTTPKEIDSVETISSNSVPNETQEKTSTEIATAETTPNETASAATISSKTATNDTQETTSTEIASVETTPSETASAETTLSKAVPDESKDTISKEIASAETTSSETASAETTASYAVPDESKDTISTEIASAETTPSETASAETTASYAVPDESKDTTSKEIASAETTPSETASAETTLSNAVPDESKDTISTEIASAETTSSETVSAETTASYAVPDESKDTTVTKESLKISTETSSAETCSTGTKQGTAEIPSIEVPFTGLPTADMSTTDKTANQTLSPDLKQALLDEIKGTNAGLQATEPVQVKEPNNRFQNIDVGTSEDKHSTWITGMTAVGEDRLVLADHNNKSVKLVDVIKKTVLFEKTLPSEPFDITSVHCTKVAVTLPSQEAIQFLSVVGNTLEKSRYLDGMAGKCTGICCFQQKLVVLVTNNNARVEIMDLQHGLSKKSIGENRFNNPVYVDADSSGIYVSDYKLDKSRVVMFNWQGDEIRIFGYVKSEGPGIIFGTPPPKYNFLGCALTGKGTAFFVDGVKISLYKISENCKEAIIDELTGLGSPQAICWDAEGMLSFSSYHDDHITVMRISD